MEKNPYLGYIGIILSVIILCFSVSFIFIEKKEFSENENRYLEVFPDLTFEKLKDGVLTKEIESFFADHFPARDYFMNLKTSFELFLGKTEVNQVYIGEDGYLIERYNIPINNKKIINQINRFTESINDAEVTFMLVPTAVTIYEDKLTSFAPKNNQLDTLDEIYNGVSANNIDVMDALKSEKDNYQLFYRLDHHWTTYGAYVGYEEFALNQGFKPIDIDGFQIETVTEDFKGTIYSKVHNYSLKGDKIDLFLRENQNLSVHYLDVDVKTDTLYNVEYLEQKDKYSMFLDNIHSIIEITNESIDSIDELIVIKDSYGNSMIPFLVNHYKKIYVIDPRYYREAISEIANNNSNIKDILILYNLNTIDPDLGIGGIY